jgi:ribosomal protein S6--L-glutamate ligase
MKTFSEASKNAKPKKKSVVFAFGRMNPPTTGHGVLVKTVMDEASKRSADHFIFVSKSQDAKKNPLTHSQKVSYLRKLFPQGNFPLNKAANPYDAVLYLCELGYTDITMIAGSDQVESYKGIAKYKGKIAEKDPKKRKYSFDSYRVVQAGEERVEKVSLADIDKMLKDKKPVDPMFMSASLMRAAAFAKRFDIFAIGIPGNKTLAKQLYNDVRKGMSLSEEYIAEEETKGLTFIALTSSLEESEKSTLAKMKEACKKRGQKFHAIRVKTATIDIAKINPDKITIQNFDGEGNDVTIVPKDTLCFVRGGTMNSEVGIALLTLLQNNGVFMVNEKGGMELCANKLQTAIALKKHNLPHPRTAFVADAESIQDAVKQIGGKFPVIVKTLTGAEGIGVSIIESEKSLVSVLQSLWKYGAEIIIQEFIPGFTHDVRSICVNGKIFASAKRDKAKGDFRTNIARGSKGGSFELSEEEIKLVERVAKVSKCYYVGIDHVMAGGKPYIIEMNASPGSGNVYTIYEDGKAIRDVEGDELIGLLIKHLSDKSNWKLFSNVAVTEDIIVDGKEFDAKVDTGNSGYNSIHATDIEINDKNKTVTFKFNGEEKMTKPIASKIKLRTGSTKESDVRPTVLFDVEFNGKKYENVKFSLADRSHMRYKVLLGIRFLAQAGVQVDPREMTATVPVVKEDVNEAKFKTKSGKTVSPARDKKADLPKKYVKGLSKTQKTNRKAQFKKRAELPDNDPDAWKKLPGDPNKTVKKSKYTQLFAKKFGDKREEVTETVNALMDIEISDASLQSKIERARELQHKALSEEQKETCDIYIEAMKAQMYEPYSNIKTTLDEDFEWMFFNSTSSDSPSRRLFSLLEYQLQGTDEIVKSYSKMTPGQKYYSEEDDKEKAEKDALYKEWRKLVNMGAKELQSFIDSEGGERAGLSRKEASKAGAKGKPIKSGRDSARAIVRMKQINREKWTANDWAWAKRQVNFINRMKGAAGKLREPDGTPTRKLLALKIWGHNPE